MKGIFYSVAAALFILPMIVFAFVYVDSIRTQSASTESKFVGDKLASFSKSIDSDLPRALNIIAKRSVQANIYFIEVNGTPLNDAETRIAETIENGTVYGNTTSINNFTLRSWAGILNAKGATYGFVTNVSIISMSITPLDSYHISIGIVISANLTDSSYNANLYRTYNTSVTTSIEDQIDPLYLLKTNGLFKRTIQSPNITVYGAASVDNAVANRFYMQSQDGPSFLDRLEGRLNRAPKYSNITSTIGLEAFVYLPELQANNLPVKSNQTSADYLYFNNSNQPGQAVNNSAYSWLRLNAEQATRYGVALI